jgi:hypothetical protein
VTLTPRGREYFNAKRNETDWDLVSGRSKARVHVDTRRALAQEPALRA